MERNVFLGLGSNLGDRLSNLYEAVGLISLRAGEVTALSSVYETEPWGFDSKNEFLNQVIKINTNLDPAKLLNELLEAERSLGGKRSGPGYSSRIIDIDILFFGNEVINLENLVIPHPHIVNRLFALVPLCELAPEMIHPVLGKSISTLLSECPDNCRIKLFEKK